MLPRKFFSLFIEDKKVIYLSKISHTTYVTQVLFCFFFYHSSSISFQGYPFGGFRRKIPWHYIWSRLGIPCSFEILARCEQIMTRLHGILWKLFKVTVFQIDLDEWCFVCILAFHAGVKTDINWLVFSIVILLPCYRSISSSLVLNDSI